MILRKGENYMKKISLMLLVLSLIAAAASCTKAPEEPKKVVAPGEAELVGELPVPDEDEPEEVEEVPEETEPEVEEETPVSVDWKNTYVSALWIYSSGETYTEDDRFSLAYIDGDDIPELLIHEGYNHASGVSVYTFRDGALYNIAADDSVPAFGSDGSMLYREKASYIADRHGNMGAHTCTIYTLTDGVAIAVRSYIDNEECGEDTVYHRINGEETTSENYHAMLDADSENLTAALYEDALPFSTENYLAVFGN